MRVGRGDTLSFTCENSHALKARGLAGPRITVRLDGAALDLSGDEGGRATISVASVDRIRQFHSPRYQGSASSMPGFHETRIWWDGGGMPAVLAGTRGRSYGSVIAAFASHVADLRGLERLEIGPDRTTAIVNAAIVGLPVLGLAGYVLWIAITDGGLWAWSAPVVVGFFGWLALRNLLPRWPRRARTLERFTARLPAE